jgi:hypothetical protein
MWSFPIKLEYRPDAHEKVSMERSKYYWFAGSKEKHWAIKLQIALGRDERFWDSSVASPYAKSDQKVYRESKVPKILAQNPDLRGLGDLHYVSEAQFIQKYKSRIEHSIKRLKDFRIVDGPYRGERKDLQFVEKVVRIICAIINLEKETHPIHKKVEPQT